MTWWEDLAAGIARFLDWLGSDKTIETVEGIVRLVLLVAQIAEKFNSPMSGHEKREFVRSMVRFVKYTDKDELLQVCGLMKDLKAAGQADSLEDWELDKLLGDSLAVFVARKGGGLDADDWLKAQY